MADELRDDILASIDTDGGEGGPADQQPAPEIADSSPTAPEPQAHDDGTAPQRDSLGRFLPKTGQEAAGAPQSPQAPLAPPQAPAGQPGALQPAAQPAALQPPPGWSVTAREQWAALPPLVQQEVHRREADMARYVNEVAPARQLGERFYQAVAPFQHVIQAEGVDPITATVNLMGAVGTLRFGTPNEKAMMLANVCKTYAVDLMALDSALAGQDMPQQHQGADPQYVQQAVQQAMFPLYQAAEAADRQRREAEFAQAQSNLQTFATDHKYIEDLRGTMADLIEMATKQGYELSLEDAYMRAAMLHPEISQIMIAQRQGANAKQLTAAAHKAKAAAVSVNGRAPVGNPSGPEPSSIRESIEMAIEANSRY